MVERLHSSRCNSSVYKETIKFGQSSINSNLDRENELSIQEEIKSLHDTRSFANHIKRDISNEKRTLLSMGFQREFINKTYMFLKPPSLNHAITFMTKENGIYQHSFISKNNSTCVVCGEIKQKHIHQEELQDNITPNNDLMLLKQKSDKKCEICEEYININDLSLTKLPCKHLICKECLIEYLTSKIEDSVVLIIPCFHHECKVILTEDYIINIIKNNSILYDKYNRFKLKAQIQADPNKQFCPYPNCTGYLLKTKATKFVTCQNGHQYCFICLQKWHPDSKCEEIVDKDFQLWAKDKVIKRCPKCNYYVEKNEGCNHITCQQCKYEWCWICLEQIVNEDHYKEGTCRGLWFANINSLEEKSKLDYNPEEEVQIVENVTNFIQLLTLLARLGGTNSNMSSMSRNSFNNNNNKCQQCKIEIHEAEVNENIPPCKHLICKECLYLYIKQHIENGINSQITCFNKECNQNYSHEFVEKQIKHDQLLLKKYQDFKMKDVYLYKSNSDNNTKSSSNHKSRTLSPNQKNCNNCCNVF